MRQTSKDLGDSSLPCLIRLLREFSLGEEKKNEIEICQKSKALLLFFYYYFKGFHVLLIDFEGNYD